MERVNVLLLRVEEESRLNTRPKEGVTVFSIEVQLIPNNCRFAAQKTQVRL